MSEDQEQASELPGDLTHEIMAIARDLENHLQEFNKLSLETQNLCGSPTADFMPQFFEDEEEWRRVIEKGMDLGAEFANRGMELGSEFASRGMELGFKFASKGEKVGPMANRVLFMATQIGVMADRIGEMGDRILTMADKIGEFGDRLTYVSQLIVYTEQMVMNFGILIHETIRTLADLITDLVVQAGGNPSHLQQRLQAAEPSRSIELVYENMSQMLRQMHEYSLKLLENQQSNRERELSIREEQLRQREATMSANACFCPCFCVASGANSGAEGKG